MQGFKEKLEIIIEESLRQWNDFKEERADCTIEDFADFTKEIAENILSNETKTEYIIKSVEEDCGIEYFMITVPDGTTKEEVWQNLNAAKGYASKVGQEGFDSYLEEYCGYKVKGITYDFKYEW